MKRTKILISTAILAAGFFGYQGVTGATSGLENERDDVSDQLEEVESDLSEAEAELAESISEVEAIESEIVEIEEALQRNEDKVAETEEEIAKKEDNIAELEDEMAELEADIEERMELLKERASSYQRDGGPTSSYLEVIMGAEGFADFISRVFTVSQIAKADQDFIDELEEIQIELESAKEEHESELGNLEEEQTELQGMIEYMEEQREEQENLQDEAEAMRADQEAMVADLTEDAENLESQEADLMDRIEAEQARIAEEEAQAEAEAQAQAEAEAEQEAEQQSQQNQNSSNNSSSADSSGSSDDSGGNSQASASSGGSGGLDTIRSASEQYFGNSTYVFGGGRSESDIANGRFDCSGFTSWAFDQIGINLPASTDAQLNSGQRVSADEMQPGDLVFFNTYKTNGHVGIYLGGGQFLGAQSSTGVAVADMNSGYWAERFQGVVVRVM